MWEMGACLSERMESRGWRVEGLPALLLGFDDSVGVAEEKARVMEEEEEKERSRRYRVDEGFFFFFFFW